MTDGIEEDVGCAVVMVGMRMNSFVTKDYFDIFIIVYSLFRRYCAQLFHNNHIL